MTTAAIIVLIISAFIIARLFRSTKLWWKLVFAITAGLLVGMLSKGLTESKKDSAQPITELISSMTNSDSLMQMQSLVATVTEGTTDCLSGVAGYVIKDEELFDALVNVTAYANGHDSPEIQNDS